MTCGIYKITNLQNSHSYIGQSINIENRIKAHYRTKDSAYIHRAIQKYGKNNFKYSILEICAPNKQELNEREQYYIKKYNTLSPNGYNLTKGGDNPGIYNQKSVSKYTLDRKFITSYPSIAMAARANNLDSRNICQVLSHKTNSCGGFQWYYTDEIFIQTEIKTNSGYDKIPVCQYDLKTGEYITTFNSLTEAACACNSKDFKGIKKCCDFFNQGFESLGFLWSYEKNKTDFLIPYNSQKQHTTTAKAVQQIDINTHEVISVFNSAKEAAEAMQMKKGGNSAILRVCHGKQKTCKGYIWRFLNG